MGLKSMVSKMFNLQGASNPNGAMMGGSSDSWTPPKHYDWQWWQRDLPTDLSDVSNNSAVEACTSTISQTVAMLPVRHIRIKDDGGKEEIKNSAVTRVMRKPNPFQTKSEFLVDLVRKTLLTGNGFGICTRNGRYEIDAIYPQLRMSPYVSYDNRDVYYSGATNELMRWDMEYMIPSRDVLHFKIHTDTHPLIGVTPLTAAMMSAATGNSIQGHTNRFFANMSRPSGVLSTEMTLTAEQTKALRTRFEELGQDMNTGGTPILTNGLKYQPVTMSAVDSEIIDTYNMTRSDVASVFRVPLALIGDMEKATFANTESLMKFWVSSGLGFIIEHLENTLEVLFDLPANERIEFDTEFLLQADFKGRIDGLKSGVQGGIFTPNEARKKEGLPQMEGGNSLLVQMQMVPIGLTGAKLQADIEAVSASTEQIGREPEVIEVEPVEPDPKEDSVSPEDAKEFAEIMTKGMFNEND